MWIAAAALADSSVVLMLAKSVAAVVINSGVAVKKDMEGPLFESWLHRQTAVDLVSLGNLGVVAPTAVDRPGN
ncbi:hypothetical protein BST27_29795 [Mycobacterium intermedium]|uniref:Uncharacterized protein n=1 Tax=Mycobacterium intermedium TaxID=28445 RepID=A0A1T3VT83_MYCIE|nr:hypothetical protein BV508_30060 [Mycobacterium intermedium]ORA89697.1 hypothetical protein BST27_29795 [Mycobacterium intermedium]